MTAPSSALSINSWEPIRRMLQINVCVLTCLSGVVFAAAEGSPLGLLNVPLALGGLILVDRKGVFELPTIAANLLGLLAFAAAGWEFFGGSIEGRLLAFGHLLLYLSWILVWQTKNNPQFWWLCALSVLQLAASSVLTNDTWFPMLAMAYMLIALWTLCVFTMDRAVVRAAGVETTARRTRGAARAVVTTGATVPSGTDDDPAVSRSRNNVRLEGASRWITPRFVLGVSAVGVASLLLGLAIFLLTPRIWVGEFQLFSHSDDGGHSLTGFAEEVRLGDLGEILEVPEIVLEVEFFDHQTGEQLDVERTMLRLGYDAPLFRGKVLGQYDSGKWSPPMLASQDERYRLPRDVALLRQEIEMHPIGTLSLFIADRGLACKTQDQDLDVSRERLTNTFRLEDSRRTRQRIQNVLQYTAYSDLSGEYRRHQGFSFPWSQLQRNEQNMTALPAGLDRLKQLARRIAQPVEGSESNDRQIAERIVSHFRDSGVYAYSLNLAIVDPTIDPVEDFLINRQAGHCEYFASATALMLRAVDIPSRLVSGFKGGQLNESSGRFEVQQLHAHVWVEAYLDDTWIVLDPTPAGREASVASVSTPGNVFTELRRSVEALWRTGLQMNQAQQQRIIYQPIRSMIGGVLETINSVGLRQGSIEWFRQLRTNPREWISGLGFVTAFFLGLVLSAGVWGARRLWGVLLGVSFTRDRRLRQERHIIEFYERFRQLLERQGHVRGAARTHQEFARFVEQQWRQQPDVDGLAELPSRLTDAFYRVRFGDQLLPADELQQLDASLGRLDAWLKNGGTS